MLIVIEGVDGSGKQTQTELLYRRLAELRPVRRLTFPNYESDTSALVKLYLNGSFGEKAGDVNPYAASSFYAVDRIGGYLSDWGTDYQNGTVILCDRYTTSNAIHQAGKLSGAARQAYLDWLFDYEYRLLGLPEPDLVLFLDVPPEVSRQLTEHRRNKMTGAAQKDLHEKDAGHLSASYRMALEVARQFHWKVIPCVRDGALRSIEDIHQEIFEHIKGTVGV